jgi:hypothetical protein
MCHQNVKEIKTIHFSVTFTCTHNLMQHLKQKERIITTCIDFLLNKKSERRKERKVLKKNEIKFIKAMWQSEEIEIN